VGAAFVYSVNPPDARARKLVRLDDVSAVLPFEPSLHTNVPVCAAVAYEPAAKAITSRPAESL